MLRWPSPRNAVCGIGIQALRVSTLRRGSEAPGNRSLHFPLLVLPRPHLSSMPWLAAAAGLTCCKRAGRTLGSADGRRPDPLRRARAGSAARVVKKVLTEVAQAGLPGEHHFFVTFATRYPGVRISPRLLAEYPTEMTVVLQHQFWDLSVSDSAFEVGLSFKGVPETLHVPFQAIIELRRSACRLSGEVRHDADAAMLGCGGERAGCGTETAAEVGGEGARPASPARRTSSRSTPSARRTAEVADGLRRRDQPPSPSDALLPHDRRRTFRRSRGLARSNIPFMASSKPAYTARPDAVSRKSR